MACRHEWPSHRLSSFPFFFPFWMSQWGDQNKGSRWRLPLILICSHWSIPIKWVFVMAADGWRTSASLLDLALIFYLSNMRSLKSALLRFLNLSWGVTLCCRLSEDRKQLYNKSWKSCNKWWGRGQSGPPCWSCCVDPDDAEDDSKGI